MGNEPKEEKAISPQQTQAALSETNLPQPLQQLAGSKSAQTDFINAITLLVAATIGGGQILTASGRFGLLGTITGLLLLGILLVYGNGTYTWQQRLIFSAAVGMSILEIFGFLFNGTFDMPSLTGPLELNLGDFLTFGFWLAASLVTYYLKTRYSKGLKMPKDSLN